MCLIVRVSIVLARIENFSNVVFPICVLLCVLVCLWKWHRKLNNMATCNNYYSRLVQNVSINVVVIFGDITQTKLLFNVLETFIHKDIYINIYVTNTIEQNIILLNEKICCFLLMTTKSQIYVLYNNVFQIEYIVCISYVRVARGI